MDETPMSIRELASFLGIPRGRAYRARDLAGVGACGRRGTVEVFDARACVAMAEALYYKSLYNNHAQGVSRAAVAALREHVGYAEDPEPQRRSGDRKRARKYEAYHKLMDERADKAMAEVVRSYPHLRGVTDPE